MHWAAHPLKVDKADKFPKNFNQDTSLSAIDVFFIYPTLLLKGKEWNARIDDKKLNKKIDTIQLLNIKPMFLMGWQIYTLLFTDKCTFKVIEVKKMESKH